MYEDKYNPNLKFYDNEEESTYLKAYKEIISKTADLLKYIKRDNPFDFKIFYGMVIFQKIIILNIVKIIVLMHLML